MASQKILIVVEKTNTGYSAYAEHEGAFATGATLTELKTRLIGALSLQFEPTGRRITEADLHLTLDLPQFFDFYRVINATALAARIGMSQSLLSQYINGIKKPGPRQTARILNGVREVGRELAEVAFA